MIEREAVADCCVSCVGVRCCGGRVAVRLRGTWQSGVASAVAGSWWQCVVVASINRFAEPVPDAALSIHFPPCCQYWILSLIPFSVFEIFHDVPDFTKLRLQLTGTLLDSDPPPVDTTNCTILCDLYHYSVKPPLLSFYFILFLFFNYAAPL